jgi:catechol 2,3-dioxygenase-like lactoylglutathione lyase family enzyme
MTRTSDSKPETVYWIDHFVVPITDVLAYKRFMTLVFGGELEIDIGLTTAARARRAPIGVLYKVGHYHLNGGFLQDRPLPPARPLGFETPRHGFYVRAADFEAHLRRLDAAGVPYHGPIATSAEGEEGSAIYFSDPDGNQYEFWAPERQPAGAMENDNPARIGRISHVVQEARDLERTADFYQRYCALERVRSNDIPAGTLVLRLAACGRLVFKHVDAISPRTGGHNWWKGQHIAFTIADDTFLDAYQTLWNELPESDYLPYSGVALEGDERTFPARTELHGLQARGEAKNSLGRGTFVYDWDGNNFHFVGGLPLDGGYAHYQAGKDENFKNDPAPAVTTLALA